MKFRVFIDTYPKPEKDIWVKYWDDVVVIEAKDINDAIDICNEKKLFADFPVKTNYDEKIYRSEFECDYEIIDDVIYHFWWYLPECDNDRYTVEYWIVPDVIPEEYKKHFDIDEAYERV